MNQKKLILILVLLLGFLLRFLFLDSFPVGVTADELQQGYTAYSILKTGKDEWGDKMPLNPRSLGDYKPPLYVYSMIPFEAILGLNLLAIRLPSALAGASILILIFFIVNLIFKDFKTAVLSVFLLSISPWHIIFSRIGWESNLGLFFFCLGVLLFLLSPKKSYLLIFSSISFGLTLFTYHSFKIFTPLFIVACVFFFKNYFKMIEKRWVQASLGVGLVFLGILTYGWIFTGSGRRANDAAIYNAENLSPLRDVQVQDKLPQPFNRMVNNKIAYLLTQFSQNYFGYFSTTFLASPHRSSSSLFNLSGRWLIPIWQFLPLVCGLYLIIKNKKDIKKLLLIWLCLAPIPAALTRDYMQTLRVENLLILVPIFSAHGIISFFKISYRRNLKMFSIFMLFFLVFWSLISDTDYYLFHHFKHPFGGMKYGYKEVIEYTEQNKKNYDKIIFTKQQSQPQIFVAFYSKVEPVYLQDYSKAWVRFEKEGYKFVDMIDMDLGKYSFRNIDFSRDRSEKNALIVLSTEDPPLDYKPIKEIQDPGGKVVFKIFDTNLFSP